MKKTIFATFLLISTVSIFATTPAQLSFWPGVKNLPDDGNVSGLKLGLPYNNEGNGGQGQSVKGLDLGLISQSINVTGAQISMLNFDTFGGIGFQLAGANVSDNFIGLQLGGYDELNNGKGCQLGIFNTGKGNKHAVQTGVVNVQENNKCGAQIGVFNNSSHYKGIQFGVLNINSHSDVKTGSRCIQIGLINFTDKGFLPFCFFFNFTTN